MKRRKPQSPDDERFEVIVWGHEGDILERLWDATFEAAKEIERLRALLEQIEAVCDDNFADACDHKLALKFVRSVAATRKG